MSSDFSAKWIQKDGIISLKLHIRIHFFLLTNRYTALLISRQYLSFEPRREIIKTNTVIKAVMFLLREPDDILQNSQFLIRDNKPIFIIFLQK